jgi:hypothetical protein
MDQKPAATLEHAPKPRGLTASVLQDFACVGACIMCTGPSSEPSPTPTPRPVAWGPTDVVKSQQYGGFMGLDNTFDDTGHTGPLLSVSFCRDGVRLHNRGQ